MKRFYQIFRQGTNLLSIMLLLCVFAGRTTAQEITTFIVGGTDTDISQIPFQVSLEINGSSCVGMYGCGGSILNAEWVVTAAHCVDQSTPPSAVTVHAGSTDQTDNNVGQRIAVDQIIIHPDWTGNFTTVGNDIALLHLAQPLCFNANVQPVAYANGSVPAEVTQVGNTVTISGWGRTNTNNTGDCATILQSAQMPIIDNATAGQMFQNCGGAVAIPNTMISFFNGTSSAAGGDSGGPAFVAFGGQSLLVGITSWGCVPTLGFPSVYTDVRDFADFITNNITQETPPCTCPNSITHITTNTLYDTDMDMPGDIFVHSGAELLIEAKIGMKQGTRILVERNARLVIDNGGVVTKGCDAPDWSGIQVLGNNQKAQPEHNATLTDTDKAGIVWIDNGTVEWARTGVTAGGGYGAEFWGGVIWTNNNATFRNNRKDVEFMQYKFALNKSRFTNTKFLAGLPTVSYANREGITIWETDGIEFDNCDIYSKGMQGIRTYDAGIKVHNGCDIESNNIGISSYATYPMSYKSVIGTTATENNFYGNQYDVYASTATGWFGLYNPNGKFSMDVVNNNFEGSRYGVVLEGPSNFRIGGNKFVDVEISAWTANTGFNNVINQNLVGCNLINARRNIGILAIGDNKQMQFLGNDFVGGHPPARDFILTNSFFPGNNGAVRALQGNVESPADNCFSDPGAQLDIVTSGTTDFFTYYYESGEPPVDCDPEPLTTGNYGKQDVPGTYTVDCSKFGGLPDGLESPTDGDLNAKRQQLQTLIPNIQTDVNAKAQYYQVLAEKEAILKYLVTKALEGEDFATVEALLAGEQGKAAQWAIFGLRMGRQDYAGAAQLLNQLPVVDVTDAQFRDIQLINLQRLQSPTGFELSTAQEAYLNSVADGYSPIRGYARGILGLLKDRVYFPDEYDITEERTSPIERVAMEALKVYPVPASDQLGVSWPTLQEGSDAQLQVFDLLGRSHLSVSLGAKETTRTLNVANLPEGVYFLIVSDKGKVAHRAKFTVQH